MHTIAKITPADYPDQVGHLGQFGSIETMTGADDLCHPCDDEGK